MKMSDRIQELLPEFRMRTGITFYEICQQLEQQLGRPVNPSIIHFILFKFVEDMDFFLEPERPTEYSRKEVYNK